MQAYLYLHQYLTPNRKARLMQYCRVLKCDQAKFMAKVHLAQQPLDELLDQAQVGNSLIIDNDHGCFTKNPEHVATLFNFLYEGVNVFIISGDQTRGYIANVETLSTVGQNLEALKKHKNGNFNGWKH